MTNPERKTQVSLVRTCDQCGTTIRQKPEDWDWFRIGSGVGLGAGDSLEACSYTCAQSLIDRLQRDNEATEERLAQAEAPQ